MRAEATVPPELPSRLLGVIQAFEIPITPAPANADMRFLSLTSMDDDAKYKRIGDESRDFMLAAYAEADKKALELERKRTAPIRVATFGSKERCDEVVTYERPPTVALPLTVAGAVAQKYRDGPAGRPSRIRLHGGRPVVPPRASWCTGKTPSQQS